MKKTLFVLLTEFYIFIFLGLVLHSSSHPQIFGKYTIKYFIFLLVLAILFWPYIKFLRYSLRTSVIKISKKKIKLTPLKKALTYILVFIFIIIIPAEFSLRYNNIEYGIPAEQSTYTRYSNASLHPFLQHQNVAQDNSGSNDLRINSLGFRGEEQMKKKPDNVYRIFLLGGSTVFNKYTPYEKNVGRVLEKMLNDYYKDKKIEVQNAGVEGYTSEHSIIEYLFKVKDLNPDLIIMWHGINDMDYSCAPDLYTRGNYQPDYSHWFGPLNNIIKTYYNSRPIINFISYDYIKHFLVSTLYSDFFKHTKAIKPPGKPINMTFESIDAYKRNLISLVRLTKSDNVKLILGNQPYLYNKEIDSKQYWDIQWLCNKNNTYPNINSVINGISTFNNATKSIAEENDIPFVDIESKLPKNLNYFIDDVHFEAKGNGIVAKTLFDSIVVNRLIENY